MNMAKFKLAQVGSLLVRELTRGQFTTTIQRRYLQRSYNQYLQSPVSPSPSNYKGISFSVYSHAYNNRHAFSTSASDNGHEEGNQQKEKISVTFIDKGGEETHIKVPVGMSMLEAAHENDIELEGACEGSLACSTCHVIVMDVDYYNKLEDPTDEENDMLDLAFGLTETSRLGCQVIAKPELDGLRLALPAATRNFAVDGHVPKPH
ncbi:hypothetical protein AQUCO_02600384v1 [Aquilegia coerulea]|uniref:2Fe-2S ferredoxin-type domain-containing protein n=1 Tax=Aquilegia coerulea TaxID=218851 RepID=A0A2G5D8T2_AQUCA|nr:hypothetical protein AQUCO_02600384v1 [Aquilegia coerulea]